LKVLIAIGIDRSAASNAEKLKVQTVASQYLVAIELRAFKHGLLRKSSGRPLWSRGAPARQGV
jgi:hypothetical protein